MSESDNQVLQPRESAAFICEHAKHVSIDHSAVDKAANDLIELFKKDQTYIQLKAFKAHPLNPKVADEQALDWLFLVDALNFSFWTPPDLVKYQVDYEGSSYTGYWSLCAAINRAIKEGLPVITAEYWTKATKESAAELFRSESVTPIPLLEERVRVMNEIGSVLSSKFGGKFSNCIKLANKNAQNLIKLVVNNFPCFKDEGVFLNKAVSFYKRVQILVADIWSCFEGEGLGTFEDIDTITMFADYRIPQTLVYFGVMKYSEELQTLLDKDHMFKSGDNSEMEIRAASIHAVELLCAAMNKHLATDHELKGTTVNAIQLDHFLWDYRRAHDEQTKHIPFHKIRCIYY